jgi:hypothetical protein
VQIAGGCMRTFRRPIQILAETLAPLRRVMLRYGYVDLLHYANSLSGAIPRFVQRTVLYDVLWQIRQLIDHPERTAFLTDAEREEFFGLLKEIFARIDCATIDTLNCSEEHKVGLLSLMKNARRPATSVYVRQHDLAKELIQFSYYSPDPQNNAAVCVDDRPVRLQHVSRRKSKFLDRTYFFEHFFWVPIGRHNYVSIRVDGHICGLKCGNTHIGVMATLEELRQAVKPMPPNEAALSKSMRELRRAAASAAAKEKYDRCWLFMDRSNKADDNAEHLYRYLLSIGKVDKAFFVLRPDSPDFPRLEAEGFQLVPFDSREHHIASINAAFLISSQSDKIRGSLILDQIGHNTARFVFLRHGVTKDDMSRWLNTMDIARLITSTPDEYASIAASDTDYKVSTKETVLTGLCRYDRLGALHRSASIVLIMPTWRKYLDVGNRNGRSDQFGHSKYALGWRSLVRSSRLKMLAGEHGLRLVFCPHPRVARYIEHFKLPDYVSLCDPLAVTSLQPVFADTAVLITDYSSVAFDTAYLEKPAIYYQFDKAEVFGGGHVYAGYFDYEQKGFGPVCETVENLIDQLELILSGNEPPHYAARRRATFPYRDGKCCERVYESILALEAPRDDDDHALTTQVTADAATPIKEQLTGGKDELRKAS